MRLHHHSAVAFLLAVGLLLTSCAATGGAEANVTASISESESATVSTSAPAAETSETASTEGISDPLPPLPPLVGDVALVEGGKTAYAIVISDGAGVDSYEMTCAKAFADYVKQQTGATVQIRTDWVRSGMTHDTDTCEILLGSTNYDETAQVAAHLSYGDYAIRQMGNKIVVFGYSDSALGAAIDKFKAIVDAHRTGSNVTVNTKWLDLFYTADVQLSALPVYDGGSFYAYYEAGFDCDEIILRDTTPQEYQAYLQTLTENGYTAYTTHTMADNLFATYTNESYTVTAGYYAYESSVRLLIEPLAPAVGLKEENIYTPVTTSQITMLGAAYTDASNGLSVLIRLTDGRFIIVDGGHSYAGCARTLRDALREQSKEYAKRDQDITIAAWIVTHAHGDHHGTLNSNYQLFQNMKVERVLSNYLSESERLASVSSTAYGANWGATEGRPNATLTAVEALGATYHQVHVGQVFYFADLTMEIMFTIESFAPNTCNALNTTSTVMRMQFGGEGGTTYLSTGDATGNGMEICSDMYGAYLQSDIIQVCHHGYSTWGNDAGMIKAYKTVNAKTLLWPQGYNAYLSTRTLAYNHVLFTLSNFKEVLVSGNVGDQIVVPIPYTVGAATVIRG